MKCLIIIPAYNESESIKSVIDELCEKTAAFEDTYDYLIVNDGSTDNTEEICKAEGLTYVSLPVNLGIGGAVQTGYIYAQKNGYDIAIQMDGDGQHVPDYLPDLIAPIKRGEYDCATGSRFLSIESFRSSGLRRLGIKFLCGIIRMVCGQKVTDATSGFRAANRKGIELFSRQYSKDYPEPESIVRLKKNGLTLTEVPVEMRERAAGESSINPLKSIYYMIKVTIAIFMAGLEIRKSGRKRGK